MKQILSITFLLFAISSIHAQESYNIKDFSNKYSAKVIVNENNEDENIQVLVYDKKTGKELIQHYAHLDLDYEMSEGEAQSNVTERPYGFHSTIICGDFNCDEEDDIAIKDGNYGCYGGPAYTVFLAKNGKLVQNSEYSRLAQEYCGFFEYDCAKREISTMTKSGCCWHQYQTYTIGKDSVILKKEEVYNGMSFPFPLIEETTWINGKEQFKTKIYDSLSDTLLIFPLADRKKSVILFQYSDHLNYCFLDKDGYIDFSFSSDFDLEYENGMDVLTFSNASAKYSIYNNEKTIGIKVTTKGKIHDMKGVILKARGSLTKLKDKELKNLGINKYSYAK